jgi:hypothetical protein
VIADKHGHCHLAIVWKTGLRKEQLRQALPASLRWCLKVSVVPVVLATETCCKGRPAVRFGNSVDGCYHAPVFGSASTS